MSAEAGQAGRGGGEEGPEGEGEGGNVIMTSEMLRKRVVTLCNAGDYGLALEVARLAQRKGAVPGGGAGESDASGDAPTGGANDVMLAEIIALLEEKARFAAEDDEDDSDTDGADDDDDDDDDDEDDEDDEDDDESSESEDGNEAAG